MQSGSNNPPWARSGLQHDMVDHNAISALAQTGMVPFQQSQVYQQNLMQTMPIAGQLQSSNMGLAAGMASQMGQSAIYQHSGVVTYPTPRALNPTAFQSNQNMSPVSQNQTNAVTKQRVFTGEVTKTHNDFGFIDEDVFFQTSVCAYGKIPKVGDRVLVEASYNANMPFKWNATRIQIMPGIDKQRKNNSKNANNKNSNLSQSVYNAVPPPSDRIPNRRPANLNNRAASPVRRDRDNNDRKRGSLGGGSRVRDRDSGSRHSRSKDSPPRKRTPLPPVYMVKVPTVPLNIGEADIVTLRGRYKNLYIPSDFMSTKIVWVDAFPLTRQFEINKHCSFQILPKTAHNPNESEAVLEAPDADYKYSAKVMLLSMPTLERLYERCGIVNAKNNDRWDGEANKQVHPTRLFKFLMGMKDKGSDYFAIGGPWSATLDGPDPDKDPSVLIKTATRTCKALTGVDLSNCTQWYRFVEFYYRRANGVVETVVIFVPDVWSCQPSLSEWDDVVAQYKAGGSKVKASPATVQTSAPAEQERATKEKADTDVPLEELKEKTLNSKIDLKTITVKGLKAELEARNMSTTGMKAQLLARLTKTLQTEDDQEKTDNADMEVVDLEQTAVEETQVTETVVIEDNEEEKPAKLDLPSTPTILVHPSKTAKGGRFNCNLVTLSVLLDYRHNDAKEHSFEVFVFAELFNEMLMRDFGFYIYKAVHHIKPLEQEKNKAKEGKDEKNGKDDKNGKDEKEKEKENEKEDAKDKEDEDKKKALKEKDKRDDERDKKSKDKDDKSRQKDKKDDEEVKVDLPSAKLLREPYLLLSFAYFDVNRCGYLIQKDLDQLFNALGLLLSRAQVKKSVEHLLIKGDFNYKKLANSNKDVDEEEQQCDRTLMDVDEVLALGNRPALPADEQSNGLEASPVAKKRKLDTQDKGDGADSESGSTMVLHAGAYIDVGRVVSALARSERVRSELEAASATARAGARAAATQAAQHAERAAAVASELEDTKKRLGNVESQLCKMTASSKIFHSTLKDIQFKVESVVNINLYENDSKDKVKEEDSEDAKKALKKESNKASSTEEMVVDEPAVDAAAKPNL